MTIEQLMDKAEVLNGTLSEGCNIHVEIENFDNIEEALKLSEQQGGMIFEPNSVTRYRWCSFHLGDIKFTINGNLMSDKQIKQYFINTIEC